MRVGEQAAIDSVRVTGIAVLTQSTKIAEVLWAMIELPSVPHDKEYQFRERLTDLLQKWNEPISPSEKNHAPTAAAVKSSI